MSRNDTLTPAQEETLAFLKKYIAEHGEAPMIIEFQKALQLHSTRSVTQRLEALERKGFITRNRFHHRSITLLKSTSTYLTEPDFVVVPVIASAGCDAMEVYAQDEFGEFIAVDKKILGKAKSIAAIKAIGDSMQDAGIKDGDHVIVEVTDSVENGDRVVAIIGNMAVIKRFSKTDDFVVLHPENKDAAYAPIVVREEDSKIFGKVLSIIPNTDWVDDIKVEYYPDYKPYK